MTEFFTKAEVLDLIKQTRPRTNTKMNTRFQVRSEDLELLQAAATARGQRIGAAARDIALASLRDVRSADTRLHEDMQALARDITEIKARLIQVQES